MGPEVVSRSPRSWGSNATRPRTATGMLEDHLAAAQEIEQLARYRRSGSELLEGEEEKLVAQLTRLSVGLQKNLRRWILIRIRKEQIR